MARPPKPPTTTSRNTDPTGGLNNAIEMLRETILENETADARVLGSTIKKATGVLDDSIVDGSHKVTAAIGGLGNGARQNASEIVGAVDRSGFGAIKILEDQTDLSITIFNRSQRLWVKQFEFLREIAVGVGGRQENFFMRLFSSVFLLPERRRRNIEKRKEQRERFVAGLQAKTVNNTMGILTAAAGLSDFIDDIEPDLAQGVGQLMFVNDALGTLNNNVIASATGLEQSLITSNSKNTAMLLAGMLKTSEVSLSRLLPLISESRMLPEGGPPRAKRIPSSAGFVELAKMIENKIAPQISQATGGIMGLKSIQESNKFAAIQEEREGERRNQKLLDALQGLRGGGVADVSDKKTGFEDGFSPLKFLFGTLIPLGVAAVVVRFKATFDFMKVTLKTLGKIIGFVSKFLNRGKLPKVLSSFVSRGNKVANIVGKVIKPITNIGKTIGGMFGKIGFLGKFAKSVGKFIPFLTPIFAAFEAVVGIFKGINAADQIENMGKLAGGITGLIGGLLDFFTFGLIDTEELIKNAGPAIQRIIDGDILGGLAEFGKGLFDTAKSGLNKLIDWVTSFFTGDKRLTQMIGDIFGNSLSFIGDGISTIVGTAGDDFLGILGDIAGGLFDIIAPTLSDSAMSILTTIGLSIREVGSWLLTTLTGERMAEFISTSVDTLLSLIGNGLSTIGSGISSVFMTIVGDGSSLAGSLLGKVASTVQSMIGNALYSLVTAIITPMADFIESLPLGAGKKIAKQIRKMIPDAGNFQYGERDSEFEDKFENRGKRINAANKMQSHVDELKSRASEIGDANIMRKALEAEARLTKEKSRLQMVPRVGSSGSQQMPSVSNQTTILSGNNFSNPDSTLSGDGVRNRR